jgi:hypothetical protein
MRRKANVTDAQQRIPNSLESAVGWAALESRPEGHATCHRTMSHSARAVARKFGSVTLDNLNVAADGLRNSRGPIASILTSFLALIVFPDAEQHCCGAQVNQSQHHQQAHRPPQISGRPCDGLCHAVELLE